MDIIDFLYRNEHAKQDMKSLKHLISQRKEDIHTPDAEGMTPLMHALYLRYPTEIIREFIRVGEDEDEGEHGRDISAIVNSSDRLGMTPLMFAVQNKNKEAVELLIDNGADIHMRDSHGNTALHYSRYVPNSILLVEKGADVNATNDLQESPFFMAITVHEPLELIRKMIGAGADVNVFDRNGNTALIFIAHYYDEHVASHLIPLLLEKGADVNIENMEGKTAYDYAKKNKLSPEIQQRLKPNEKRELSPMDKLKKIKGIEIIVHKDPHPIPKDTTDPITLVDIESGDEIAFLNNHGAMYKFPYQFDSIAEWLYRHRADPIHPISKEKITRVDVFLANVEETETEKDTEKDTEKENTGGHTHKKSSMKKNRSSKFRSSSRKKQVKKNHTRKMKKKYI